MSTLTTPIKPSGIPAINWWLIPYFVLLLSCSILYIIGMLVLMLALVIKWVFSRINLRLVGFFMLLNIGAWCLLATVFMAYIGTGHPIPPEPTPLEVKYLFTSIAMSSAMATAFLKDHLTRPLQ